MRFSQVQGSPDIVRAFVGMIDSGRIPHAILLHEEDGGGAFALAMSFLQYLYCQDRNGGDSCGVCPSCNKISKLIHPDIHFVFPVTSGNTSRNFLEEWRELVQQKESFTEEDLYCALGIEGKSTMIAVPQAKEIMDILSLSALEGGYRSVVVYLPEKMNKEAANRLLKLVEEPPQKTQFIFITHAPEKVLLTISSRCERLRVKPVSRGPVQRNETYASLLEELMDAAVNKDLPSVLETADGIAALPSRDSAKAFCSFAAGEFRKLFLLQQGLDNLAGDVPDCIRNWAGLCRKTFAREALAALSRACQRIERNVNLKILFAELACKLYTII